jgi:hypothetical protein
VGAFSWLVVSVTFGIIIGNPIDPRVVLFAVVSVGLLLFSIRDALSAAHT